MRRFTSNKRRLISFVVALLLGLATLRANAQQQCLNGCSYMTNCPMLRATPGMWVSCERAATPYCARRKTVPSSAPAQVASQAQTLARCSQGQCVLRVQSRLEASLVHADFF